jgi:hypothetical protein
MNRVLAEQIADRLEEIESDLQQARAVLGERSTTYREDPTPENLELAQEAFLHVKDVEQMHEWMKSEIGMQRRER